MKNKKILIPSILLLLALIGGAAYMTNKNNSSDKGTETSAPEADGINYSPPTDEDKKSGDDIKASLPSANNDNPKSSNSQELKKVKPVVTYSGQYGSYVEVSSRVPNVYESKGTCTLLLAMDTSVVEQSKAATPNVTEMSCGLIKIASSKLSKGSWNGHIKYTSSKAKGTSETFTVNVK